MTRRLIWCWLLFGLIGCAADRERESAPAVEALDVRTQALTNVTTLPGNGTLGAFGPATAGGVPTYGQVITAPATDVVLERFSVMSSSLPATLIVRGEVYAWTGTRITGPQLFQSSALTTTSTAAQELVFNAPAGGVTLSAGSQYVLVVTTLRDAGTGTGNVLARGDNPYAGGSYVFTSGNVESWSTNNWSTLSADLDLAFTARFVALGVAPTTVQLTSSVIGAAVYSQSINFNARVFVGSGVARGTMTFRDGATVLQTVVLDANGQTNFRAGDLSVGSHSISASYSGSSVHRNSSATLDQTVNRAVTRVSISSRSNPASVGSTVFFNASVSVDPPATATARGGLINFRDGTTLIGPATFSPGRPAEFPIASLSVGTHSITAVYPGDNSLAASTSPELLQRIDPAATTLALTTSAASSTYGNPITFTATLSASAVSGVLTGSVTFSDGATVLGSGTLQNGSAVFTTSALVRGTHSIAAAYAGDTRHTSATGALTQTVTQAASSAQLAVAPSSATYAQLVTLSASVTGMAGAALPSGAIRFFAGDTELGTAQLNAAGQASLNAPSLRAGTHNLSVRYAGDNNYTGRDSDAVSLTVSKADTTISVASSSSPVLVGAPLTLTATVVLPAGASDAASGLISFRDGTTLLGTAALNASGTASLTTSQLAVGPHAITVAYAGDNNFNASSSARLDQVVSPHGTTATLASSSQPASFGSELTFTATLTAAGTPPTGNVEFSADDVVLGTAQLVASRASFRTSTLGVGTRALRARYAGDTDHGPAGASLTQTVTVASTETQIASSTNPSLFGQSVTFRASVAGATTQAPLTGSVVFSDGSSTLGSSVLDANGVASWSSTSLAVAVHALSAQYQGDSNFGPSGATGLDQVVDKAATSTSLAFSLNPARAGASLRLNANVAAQAPGAGTPGGSVEFKEGDTLLATATLDVAGAASAEIASPTPGVHAVRAEYAGDASFRASAAPASELSVALNTVELVLSAEPTPATFGDRIALKAVATAEEGTPSGNIEFSADRALGSATLDAAGSASHVASDLAAGSYTLQARYAGDATHAAATATHMLTVRKAASNTTLTSSANPAKQGDSVSFEARVTSPAGSPSGDVEFFDGTTRLATVALLNGSARLSTDTLASGGHGIYAAYRGDSNYEPSAAEVIAQSIEAITEEVTDPVVPTEPEPDAPDASEPAEPTEQTKDPSLSGGAGGGCGCHVVAPRRAPWALVLGLAGLCWLAVRRRGQ